MIIKPVSSLTEILTFFTKRYNQFPEHLRYSLAVQRKVNIAEFLWEANKMLLEKRGFNSLFFFFVKDSDKVARGLVGAYEYFPGCLEILTYTVQGFKMTHYKGIKFFLDELEKAQVLRVQAFVYEKSNFYVKVLEKEGWKSEGLVLKYDGRFNYYLMGKVF